MAALDFPASPTNGQVYGNFIWSSAKGAWQAKPITGKVTTSATAPSAPTNGDEWFNTNDGNLYVYYTDVDGSQWVQVKSDATLSSTLGNRVELLEAKPSGLVPVIPTSVTVGSGNSSVSSSGVVSFTSASSIKLNGVFTSAYRNYKLICSITGTSVSQAINVRFSTGGTDDSSSIYAYAATYSGGGSTSVITEQNAGSTSLANVTVPYTTNNNAMLIMELVNPFLPQATMGDYMGHNYRPSQGIEVRHGGFTTYSTTSYDGANIIANSGNITGNVQVLGYRN